MAATSWKSIGEIQVAHDGDRVVVRSQWEKSLIAQITFGALFIAGIVAISAFNYQSGLELDYWGTPALILLGLLIMFPRRLTTSFDVKARQAIRDYEYGFGLIRRKRKIPFDDIEAVGIRNYNNEGFWDPVIMRKNEKTLAIAIKGGARDDAIKAVEAIASATAIALDQGGFISAGPEILQLPPSTRWRLEGRNRFELSPYALGEYRTEDAAVAAAQARLAELDRLQATAPPDARDEVGVVGQDGNWRQIFPSSPRA